jgi:hypothetical protein
MATTKKTVKKTVKKLDKYDRAIAYLKKNPENIHEAWINGNRPGHPHGGCLFQHASKSGYHDAKFGCLTQIRQGGDGAATVALTKAILSDHRIPNYAPRETDVEILPVFAEWQRKIDKVLKRK